MDTQAQKKKKSAFAAVLFMVTAGLLIPFEVNPQIIAGSIIDLRTKIANHAWSFHPGDSPVVKKAPSSAGKDNESIITLSDAEDTGEEETRPDDGIAFAWAKEKLAANEAGGWIKDMQIQLAWTRYRDREGTRPFQDFNKYRENIRGTDGTAPLSSYKRTTR